jgi:hypothetical protein
VRIYRDRINRLPRAELYFIPNFRVRVVSRAPMSDIESSWNAYNDSDADWNANLMNSIVGLERYYGAKRSAQTEGKIQMLFLQLDDELAALRRSDIVKELRAGKEPDATQQADGVALAYGAAKTTETLRNQLYALARCFPSGNKSENLR